MLCSVWVFCWMQWYSTPLPSTPQKPLHSSSVTADKQPGSERWKQTIPEPLGKNNPFGGHFAELPG